MDKARNEAGVPIAGPDGLPPELQQLLAALVQAAASGQDIGPMLENLRSKLLEADPQNAAKIDALLNDFFKHLAGLKEG